MYYVVNFIVSFLLPLAAACLASLIVHHASFFLAILVMPALVWATGYLMAQRSSMPESFIGRFWPLIAPVWLFPLALIPYALLTQGPDEYTLFTTFSLGLIVLVPTYFFYWLAFFVTSERRFPSSQKRRGIVYASRIFIICILIGIGSWIWARHDILQYDSRYDPRVGHGVDVSRYSPFVPDNELVKPAHDPSLTISANYPRLDGAIALLPVYGAAAQAVYKGLDDYREAASYVKCTNTPSAYRRLIDGEANIFFGLGPSSGQKKYAQSKGLTLIRTPIAREAFVFLTHKTNPVENLTLEQIQDIYSGKITRWREVGGVDEKIMAFQRPEDSGSQTTMKEAVMRERPLTKPLRVSTGMGDLIAAYRNHKNALGYSFRWYATVQYPSPDIKFLSINGISPTLENIQNGSYPLIADFEAVTARPLSPESQALITWLTGPEGQDLISRVGYAPLGSSVVAYNPTNSDK